MNVQLLVIDPQNDFCDPKGSLFVTGADQDSARLATMINRLSKKIDDVNVTLDSHRTVDVAHPIMYVNSNGKHPDPFTIISHQDLVSGVWTTTNPSFRQRMVDYTKSLEDGSRYPLCIWPPHCLISTWGHAVIPCVSDALVKWENDNFGVINFVTKGSNIFTEHYSAYKAEVPDPSDASTMPNTDLLEVLQKGDDVLITGQALSHCVANTVRDLADDFGDDNIKKFVLLEDTCSNVTGFDSLGVDFVKDLSARGMRITTSADYLA